MNAEQLMQQDTISRQKIVDQTDSNFFVEAGAGSGKTTILVKRMVAMVEQGLDVLCRGGAGIKIVVWIFGIPCHTRLFELQKPFVLI